MVERKRSKETISGLVVLHITLKNIIYILDCLECFVTYFRIDSDYKERLNKDFTAKFF